MRQTLRQTLEGRKETALWEWCGKEIHEKVQAFRKARRQGAILGFPCSLKDYVVRRSIRDVLERIRERAPTDWERLQGKVYGFKRLPSKARQEGTLGQLQRDSEGSPVLRCTVGKKGPLWLQDKKHPFVAYLVHPEAVTFCHKRFLRVGSNRPGWILLPDAVDEHGEARTAAAIAHELGHAATTSNDISRRKAPSDQWASEASAEHYVYKWGFGRESARGRKYLSLRHHGPAPGQIVTEIFTTEGISATYRVTRHFCFHLVEKKRISG